MDIQWVRYKGEKTARYLLVLRLGSRNSRHCLLDCSKVPDPEVKLLRASWRELGGLSLDGRLAWVKSKCPVAWQFGYRELPSSRLEVVQRY